VATARSIGAGRVFNDRYIVCILLRIELEAATPFPASSLPKTICCVKAKAVSCSRVFTEAAAPSRLANLKHCLACGLNDDTSHSISSSASNQSKTPGTLFAGLHPHCRYTRPRRDPPALSFIHFEPTSPVPHISCTGTCFRCSFPAMALNLEKALQHVRTSSTVFTENHMRSKY
jgi:hypothetical protein